MSENIERDPNDINPNWKRPSDWKYKADWDSPNWKKWRHESGVKRQLGLEMCGFSLCPKCNTQHTALTFSCRNCNHKAEISEECKKIMSVKLPLANKKEKEN